MEKRLAHKVFHIDGMTCTSCEMRIENSLKKLEGIIEAKAIYSSSNVYVTFDMNLLKTGKIIETIESLDYKVTNKPQNAGGEAGGRNETGDSAKNMKAGQLLGIGIIVLAFYMIIKNTVGFNFIPQVDQSMGYGILFIIGLITSLHCMAMCGGINLSVCIHYGTGNKDSRFSKLKPSAMYNLGRIVSYTLVGGLVGALGSAVSFSGRAKGIIAIASGIFMIVMGLNMLNIFPGLRRFNPRMPKILGRKVHGNAEKHGPLFVGLLNGLMPCGPLQAMQLYALGTGSFVTGAISMLLFSLGTVPLMFGFGAVSSLLSGKFTHKMMKASAVLVMVLGVIMMSRGLNLSGYNLAFAVQGTAKAENIARIDGEVQTVTMELESGRYSPIVVQKDIPVRWIIKAEKSDLNGCNNPVTIPKYNIRKKLVPGDNIIEFTPKEEGNIVYTCWMGMIGSNIKVVPDINKVNGQDIVQSDGSDTQGLLSAGAGCCAAGSKATEFAGGKIPTDDIQIASVKDNRQEVVITVNDYGYSPAVVVLQKGVKAKIKFNTEKLNSCNNEVVFPEYRGQLDLQSQTETPDITPEQDFTFQCWMGMLHGYVKVVEDIDKVNLDDIKSEINNFKPASGSSGGCCNR